MIETIAKQTGCAIPAYSPPSLPPLAGWARSGLMALTGPRNAKPLMVSRDYIARIGELCHCVEAFSRASDMPVTVDQTLLTERAAFLGLHRDGCVSANGTCRMVKAKDGWLAVNLPRRSDIELLPAWLGADVANDVWSQIADAARERHCGKLVADAQVLGLAVAQVDSPFTSTLAILRPGKLRPRPKRRPLVLDMSSLWAGPLCGALLADADADVIKLESWSRPDGARFGHLGFFARMNAKKRSLALDLPQDRETLRKLFEIADVVIDSARPRVMANWGFSLPGIFATNPHLTWISITAYGRTGPRDNWVGFGDDVAAAAGLCIESDGTPMFIGDALADPLAGLMAAASAFASLAAGGGFFVDASLFAAARFVASAPHLQGAASVTGCDDGWLLRDNGWLESVRNPVLPATAETARTMGADNEAVLRKLLSRVA
jgi:hypothetical protein